MSPREMLLMTNQRSSAADRFWARVEQRGSDECWPWKGGVTRRGYGRLCTPLSSSTPVHKIALILAEKEIPEGHVIDHTCRNRLCVNPAHLRAVTPRANSLENSAGPTAVNAAKTHCKNGHPLEGDNLLIKRSGYRQCRTCQLLYRRAWRAARRSGAAPPQPPYPKEQSRG